MTARDLLALIALRDYQDSMTRAVAWMVMVRHEEFPEQVPTFYGPFEDSAPALVWAVAFERGLNVDGEDGFRCVPVPVLPAT